MTYGFFRWLDKEMTNEAKVALAGAMKLKEVESLQIANALVALLERIYSYPLLSLRAFLRSASLTLIVTAAFSYEYLNTSRLLAGVWGLIVDGSKAAHLDRTAFLLDVGFYSATLFTNALTDYGSVFLIRECFQRLGGKPVSALLVGATVGMTVVGLGALLRTEILWLYASHIEGPIGLGALQIFARASFVGAAPAAMVFAWLPLFAFAILVIRAITPLSWLVTQVQWALRGCAGNPLKAVGYVAAAIVFLATAGWRIIFRT
jgi:hypothetical protein